ncbi:hypothetical protein [Synechococcus sp. 1G10]|uniref:hypothetical protein n=1 Tax=Synechococcus sp. 1G10 TaxID=2025605 RepID=UPI00117EF283|nr:hypothetical protein [Synechococcus sp. 1G10]
MSFRRNIDPRYKQTRSTIAERRAAHRRKLLENFDVPLTWWLTGPEWPCCPVPEGSERPAIDGDI